MCIYIYIYSKIEEEKDRVCWVKVVHGDNVFKDRVYWVMVVQECEEWDKIGEQGKGETENKKCQSETCQQNRNKVIQNKISAEIGSSYTHEDIHVTL